MYRPVINRWTVSQLNCPSIQHLQPDQISTAGQIVIPITLPSQKRYVAQADQTGGSTDSSALDQLIFSPQSSGYALSTIALKHRIVCKRSGMHRRSSSPSLPHGMQYCTSNSGYRRAEVASPLNSYLGKSIGYPRTKYSHPTAGFSHLRLIEGPADPTSRPIALKWLIPGSPTRESVAFHIASHALITFG